MIQYSRLAHKFELRWESKLAEQAARGELRSVESEIQKQGYRHPLFRAALEKTLRIFRLINKEVGEIPTALVLVDPHQPYRDGFRAIAKKIRKPLILPFGTEATKAELLHPDGAHFNERGNQLFGQLLVTELQRRKLLPAP